MSDSATEPPELNLIGQSVGKYKVTRLIGRGGMGAVYEMVHQTIGQRAAIKVLFQKYAHEPEFVERFRYEAQVVNQIEHPGLVKISDHGQLPDGTLYIVMEYLEGQTLRARLDAQRTDGQHFESDQALELIRQLAETLRVVHAHGVVHRDLKPENIFHVRDPAAMYGERVKILDFGIAKIVDQSDVRPNDSPGPLTTVGKLLGTPTYMSPEQCDGYGQLSSKSDVYALGAIWFELLTGSPPFANGSANAIMAQHLLKTAPRLRSVLPNASAELDTCIASMLAKKPTERPDMAELLATIDALREGGDRPRSASTLLRRPKLFLGAASVVLLAGAVATASLLNGNTGKTPVPAVPAHDAVPRLLPSLPDAGGAAPPSVPAVSGAAAVPRMLPTSPQKPNFPEAAGPRAALKTAKSTSAPPKPQPKRNTTPDVQSAADDVPIKPLPPDPDAQTP